MKTKKIRIRQGFTIVELVIVIGVVGVLSAVLIPTFINLNQKANRASDESLIKNLNTALAMKEQDPKDTKNVTMGDAIEDLKEYGYLLPNLVTKSEDKLLWNQKTNRFILESDDKGDQKPIEFWRIQDSITGDEIYSVYSGLNFEGAGENKDTVTVSVGFDAGENKEIKIVNYVHTEGAGQSVVVRTNGGTLTINAPKDTVTHYGAGKVLDIKAVASESYHEFGSFPKASIAKGRMVVENGGEVSTIVVEATSASDVAIDLTNVKTENAPVVYAENEAVVAALDTIVTASEQVKESSIQEVVFTKHVTNEEELDAALNENGYVIVDNNIEVSEPIWVGKVVNEQIVNTDHKVTLDLNGKTLTAGTSFEGRPIMNRGELTITGNGAIDSSTSETGGWGSVRNYNKLTIENGTFKGSPLGGGSAIDNWEGELTINDGWFGGTGSLNNRDNGVAVINGGKFVSEACSKLPGSVWCYALRSSGKITINDAYVRGAQGAVAINGGEALINNVDAETYVCSTAEGQIADHSTHGDVTFYALYVAGEYSVSNCTVKGGHFKSDRLYAVYTGNSTPGDGGNLLKAHFTIYGGEYISPEGKAVVYLDGTLGSAYLYGGKFSNNNVSVGGSAKHLSDIASPDVTETVEGNWYVIK